MYIFFHFGFSLFFIVLSLHFHKDFMDLYKNLGAWMLADQGWELVSTWVLALHLLGEMLTISTHSGPNTSWLLFTSLEKKGSKSQVSTKLHLQSLWAKWLTLVESKEFSLNTLFCFHGSKQHRPNLSYFIFKVMWHFSQQITLNCNQMSSNQLTNKSINSTG